MLGNKKNEKMSIGEVLLAGVSAVGAAIIAYDDKVKELKREEAELLKKLEENRKQQAQIGCLDAPSYTGEISVGRTVNESLVFDSKYQCETYAKKCGLKPLLGYGHDYWVDDESDYEIIEKRGNYSLKKR